MRTWQTRSFFIELKPRTEFASLFLDCPPTDHVETTFNEDTEITGKALTSEEALTSKLKELRMERKEVVNIRAHSIALSTVLEGNMVKSSPCYLAKFGDLTLKPNSVCALTWSDNNRLFMCKVRAEVGGCPLGPKTFRRLAADVSSEMLLDEYVENAQSHPVRAECGSCSAVLLNHNRDCLKIHSLPEDDWLNTAPSMEYFCRDTCGASHSRCHEEIQSFRLLENAHKHWLPNEGRIVLSDSYILVLREMVVLDAIVIDERSHVVHCAKCSTELGVIFKRNPGIVQFHHVICHLMVTGGREIYINTRFGTLERFLAWMLLYQCEAQTSLKLVLRSYDKRPYLLVWLLDSYVAISQGELHTADSEQQNCGTVYSFPALKMLYKIFDSESAKTDPRANGEDASVGIVDVPLICCEKLTEMLLASSLALPPAGRNVGQFYVGYMKLKNVMD